MSFKLKLVIFCACMFGIQAFARVPQSGVILMYHHVSTETPAVTSISPDGFATHMQYLSDHHNVIALEQLVEKVRANQPIPDKAVAITFDDGFENIYQNAHPILRKFQFPYTVFINPALIERQPNQLSWQQINEMTNQGARFANHSSEHNHLLQRNLDETEQQWLNRTLKDILDAQTTLEQKLKIKERYLAYPFGEFNLKLKSAIQARGFTGFGQHSGAIASHSDFSALPRFAAAGIYANLETLKVKLNSLALPVIGATLIDPDLSQQSIKPSQTLTLAVEDFSLAQLNCYFASQALPIVKQQTKITLNLSKPLSPGRARINCTAPSMQDPKRYYWYSQPYFVPTDQGRWLD